MTPYFFVSHATGDADAGHLQRFFGDLQRELRNQLGYPPDATGELWAPVHGQEPPAGTYTPDTPDAPAASALTCRVLVAAYSDAYVRSTRCVREWSAFHDRMRWYQQRTGAEPASLIGIPWSAGFDTLPGILRTASRLPTNAVEMGRTGGLRHLMSEMYRSGASERYLAFVRQVAGLVVAGAAADLPVMTAADLPYARPRPELLAAAPPTAESAPVNAAGAEPARQASPPDAEPEPPLAHTGDDVAETPRLPARNRRHTRNLGRVGVVIAAATADEQPSTRTRRDFYGTAPEDWRPFLPATGRPAFALAQAALSKNAIYDTVCYPVGAELTEQLARARADRRVIVLLVDPWITGAEPYQELPADMERWLATDPAASAGMLAVFSSTDEETEEQAENLRAELSRWFAHADAVRWNRRKDVRTHEELATDIVSMVIRTQNMLINMAGPGPGTGPGDIPDDPDQGRPVLRRRWPDDAER
ncbi:MULTISPECIES: FxsC protein [unclassified Frankia]|uniref:FxsC protein n=1 Tax=unclassified Frankia TaxID=2632575 RepID=UPI0020248F70